MLLVEKRGPVARVTLDRPEVRNAFDDRLVAELTHAFRNLDADAEVRVVVLAGNGPAFCAGADLKEREGMDEDQVRARRMKAFDAYSTLEALPMPTIAVVHGPAVGSGVEIAAACDFVVATPQASFRTPEALRGTVGATQRLPRVIGKRLAKDLMLTGRTLGAEEAAAHGFVARVVPGELLEKVLDEIAAAIVSAPAASLRLAKRTIDRGVELDPKGALETEIAAIEEQIASGVWMGRR